MRYNHGEVSLVMCCALQSHETAVQWLVYCAIIREFKIRRLRTTNYGWTSAVVCL